jgi:hypothetical protein
VRSRKSRISAALTIVRIHERSEKFRPSALSFNKINVNNDMMWMYPYATVKHSHQSKRISGL